jgi:hypothetical protein
MVSSSITYFISTNSKTLKIVSFNSNGVKQRSDTLVCNFKLTGVVKSQTNRIQAEVHKENEAMKITFIDLNSETPSIVGNTGDRESVVKVNSGDTLYLIEKTPLGNINIWTLFRDKGIGMLSKQYQLLSDPFGMIMIGDCVGD